MSTGEWIALGVGVVIQGYVELRPILPERLRLTPGLGFRKWFSCIVTVIGVVVLAILFFSRDSLARRISTVIVMGYVGAGAVSLPLDIGRWLAGSVRKKASS